MPSALTRLLLCISSYFPLLCIFALQLYFQGKVACAVLVLAVGVLGLSGLAVFLRLARSMTGTPVTVTTMNRRDSEAMSYIVSYLLPFVALPGGSLADELSLGVFLLVLGILYVNSDMIHINPMLNLAQWHIYEITLTSGDTRSLILRSRIRKGAEIKVVRVATDLLLEVKNERE